jgi:hypothetical protein
VNQSPQKNDVQGLLLLQIMQQDWPSAALVDFVYFHQYSFGNYLLAIAQKNP